MGTPSTGCKKAYTFYLHPDVSRMIDAGTASDGRRSRSEFVEDAVSFYCGVLDAKDNRAFLGEEIVKTMRAVVRESEGRLLSHLRSEDISLSMLAVLFAASLTGMTAEEIERLRAKAVEYVDENFRARSFVSALYDERKARGML